MVYVVERYLPGLSRSDLLRGLSRLERGMEEVQGEAPAVHYLGSTIVLGDEACFCQFEGPSEEAVAEANRKAGLSFNRIVPAVIARPVKGEPMIVSTSIPATIQIRRRRLLGLIVAVALVAAGITWALLTVAVDTGSGSVQTSAASVRSSLTPVQQATVYGGPGAVLDALGFGPQEKQFVQGFVALAKAQQAAASDNPGAMLDALGFDPQEKQFVQGMVSLAKAQQAAASDNPGAMLDALGFNPQEKQFVQGITTLAQAQQAAASGR
jgi:Protein of unknown function (DUF4242)